MTKNFIFPNTNPNIHTDFPIYPTVDDSVKPWKKRGRGHPTKYQEEETIAMTFEYLDDCEEKYVTVPIYDEDGDRVRYKTGDMDEKARTVFRTGVPTIAGLAAYLGVAKSTIYNWTKSNAEYLVTVETLKTIQETRLIEGSLSGLINVGTANLILSSDFEYVSRNASDITTDGESLNKYDNDKTNEAIAARERRADRGATTGK